MQLERLSRLDAQRAGLERELIELMPGAWFDQQSRKLTQIYRTLESYQPSNCQEAAVLLGVAVHSMKDNGPFETLVLEIDEIAGRWRKDSMQAGDARRLRCARDAIADLPDVDHEPWCFEMGFYWGGDLKERSVRLVERAIGFVGRPRLVHEGAVRASEQTRRNGLKIAL